jgi:hypothetical protein
MELLSVGTISAVSYKYLNGGDAGGKGGNLKKNRLSRDLHRLNSDKRAERQD